MGGDKSKGKEVEQSRKSMLSEHELNRPKLNVDLANPSDHLLAQRTDYVDSTQVVGTEQLDRKRKSLHGQVHDSGPIKAITLPDGWEETTHSANKREIFSLRADKWYSPADDNTVEFHVACDSKPIVNDQGNQDPEPPPSIQAFRDALKTRPHPLFDEEFKNIAPMIQPVDGGNNQLYKHFGDPEAANFLVKEKYTDTLNGRRVLVVKGDFIEGPSGGRSRVGIFVNSGQDDLTGRSRVEQVFLTAQKNKFHQYEKTFWDALKTIEWN